MILLWLLVIAQCISLNDCPLSCTNELYNNYLCDKECNSAECNYDNSDCMRFTYKGEIIFIGDCLANAKCASNDWCECGSKILECYKISPEQTGFDKIDNMILNLRKNNCTILEKTRHEKQKISNEEADYIAHILVLGILIAIIIGVGLISTKEIYEKYHPKSKKDDKDEENKDE